MILNRFCCFLVLCGYLLTSSCAVNHPIISQDHRSSDATALNAVENLYRKKQYHEALIALLKIDADRLGGADARKMLWKINDRLVTVQWYLQKSIIALKKGRKEAARLQLEKALELYPSHEPSLLLQAALTTMVLEEPEEIEPVSPAKDEKNAIETSPPPTEEMLARANDLYLTGEAYFNQGQMARARDSWRQGLELVPSHPLLQKAMLSLLNNEGLQAFGQKDLESAITFWEEALEIEPTNDTIRGYLDKARQAQHKVRSLP